MSSFVAQSLGLRSWSQRKTGAGLWELGLAQGQEAQPDALPASDGALELVAGNNAVPLAELVSYRADGITSIDQAMIRQLVDTATTGDSRYTPTNARREARKLETQALHESWRRNTRRLKKRRPEMSDVWYSQQIAKMGIAKGRSSETSENEHETLKSWAEFFRPARTPANPLFSVTIRA